MEYDLVQTTSVDEPEPGVIDSSVNFSKDEEALGWVRDNISNLLPNMRAQRVTLNEEWTEIRRMTTLLHDSNQKYLGRSKAYVPLYLKAEETITSLLSQGLFPSDDFMEVTDRLEEGSTAGDPVKNWLWYQFEKAAKLRAVIKLNIKSFLRYGHCVAKMHYNKALAPTVRTRAKKLMDATGVITGYGAETVQTAASKVEGIRWDPRNIFFWHIWPMTAGSVEEATLVFEDIQVPRQYIREMCRLERWDKDKLEDALNAPIVPETDNQQQELLIEQTGTSQSAATSSSMGGDVATWRFVTEAWFKMPVPDALYVNGEEKGTPVPVKATFAGGVLLELRRNPFWHQMPPYLVARMRPEEGSFYSKGMGYAAKYLQYLVNDFANQVNDNGIYGLNPFAIVNPSSMAGPISPLRPGGLWFSTDPQNGVRFDRPPIEQLGLGLQLLQFWVSMLMDTAGAPPILQGTNAGKGARTATSSQILQKNASSPIQDLVVDFENAMMMPAMEMAWELGQQYSTADLMFKIAGQPVKVKPEQLMGDFDFRWLASSQAANQAQRAQQVAQLLPMLPNLSQLLAAEGKRINTSYILQRLWGDGWGFRGFDQLITALPPQQPGMMGPGGPPPLGGPPGLPPGQPGTHAASQVGGGDMAPGEGEEQSNVADMAQFNAAMQGG